MSSMTDDKLESNYKGNALLHLLSYMKPYAGWVMLCLVLVLALTGFDLYGVYDISEEDIQRIKDSLDSVSSKNKEVSMKAMLKVRGERQMCDLKLHTLWSSLKTDGYIGIIGQLDIVE